MTRVLFVVPPLTGHVNPTVSIAAALEARGAEVAWVGHPSRVRPLLPEGATLLELSEKISEDVFGEDRDRGAGLRGFAALKFLWEGFLVPLADHMVEGVLAAVEQHKPDLLVVDQQALAGMLAARKLGVPWATTVSTSAGLTGEIGLLPAVKAWRDELLAGLQRRHGLEPIVQPDLSPGCVIVLSTPELVGDTSNLPPQVHFVGPAFRNRPHPVSFPWDDLVDRPRLLVSLGTVNAERGARFYKVVCDAFADGETQVILSAPAELVPDLPPHGIRRDWLPQVELLGHVDVVLSHGGHNTVCEALSHGVPLVVTPIKDDQPVVARQVRDAGAGLQLKFGRVGADKLRQTVDRVRTEVGFRQAAARVAESFAAAGGAERAAEVLLGQCE